MFFKAVFEKAYHSVSWHFLLYMLRRMDFCKKWILWIEGCLKSASISILINDSPSSEFTPQRGLRQRDPLSPILINVVAEGLNELMREATKKNLFHGFLVDINEVEVSILQYSDDTLFFGKASIDNVKAIKVILRSFELVSGLKINFSNSSFGTNGMSESWNEDAARYLNYRLLAIPFLYLGLPIGANPRRSDT